MIIQPLCNRCGDYACVQLVKGVAVLGDEAIMAKKEHGTCSMPVMEDLRWNCDYALADKISCYTRRFAENAGYSICWGFIVVVIVATIIFMHIQIELLTIDFSVLWIFIANGDSKH